MDPLILVSLLIPAILLLASILLYNIITSSNHAGKTPPGPRGLPILGYLPFMGTNLLQQLTNLSHQYGPIFQLRLGTKLAVVITSPSLVKEVVRDHDHVLAHRDATVAALIYSRGARDLVFSPPNASWRAMRKVLVRETQSTTALHASRQLRSDEIRAAVRSVYSEIGRPVAIGKLVLETELNLMMSLMWGGGEREGLGTEFRALNSELSHLLGKPNLSDLFPILSWLDLQGVKKQMGKVVDKLDHILDQFISQHENLSEEALKEGRKDFLQVVLEKKDDSDLPTLSRDQIKSMLSVSSLFSAHLPIFICV